MNQIIKIIAVLFAVLAGGRPARAQTHFTEVGVRAGVSNSESNALAACVSWADFDNDGYQDVYVTYWGEFVTARVTPEGVSLADTVLAAPCRLYRNNRDGTFTEVAAAAGVADNGVWATGGAWGDYDNDGNLDLYVPNLTLLAGGNGRLYRNRGDGTFENTTASSGVASGPGAVEWVDYDNDGWLDLYLPNTPVFDAEGHVDLASSIPSKLYRNNRDGTFTDVAARAGVAEYGNGGIWGDYDDDNDLDLYLVGGGVYPNPSRLYRNNGEGTFTDVAVQAGVDDVPEAPSVNAAWGDYDNDGHLDLYRVNNDAANELFRNKGNGTFKNMAADAGVADDKTGFAEGPIWGDYDNDGFLDLYVLNIGSSSPCRLYHNNGDGTFTDVGLSTGANIPDGGAGAWGDYDNDGFLDLFVDVVHVVDGAQLPAPNLLFHNEGNNNHYLVLQLKGTLSNRDAIGTKVTAVTGKTRQRRDVESAGSGWGSQPSLPVEFGFGSVAVVDSLIIRWPSGIVQVMTQVPTDQYLTLAESRETEPTAVLEEQLTALPAALSLSQNYPNPFNSSTVIRFALPGTAEVELGVYDLAGQRVALLVAGTREAGTYAVNWDGRDERGRELASGTYLYSLRVGEREETRKLTLLR